MVAHRIVLTGGGTGGHVYPALAVAEQLRYDQDVQDILYIGASGHIEEKLARERKLKFFGMEVSGIPRRFSLKLFSWPLQFFKAFISVRKALIDFHPTAVLGTGGYASGPALLAAYSLGIPYAIHEPDAHPGLANRVFARYAGLVSCGMQRACERLKPVRGAVAVNGNPVGKNFLNLLPRDSACAVLGLRPDLPTVLITGGSQGARAINETVIDALPELLAMEPHIQIIHQVGEKNFYDCKERINQAGITNNRYFLRDYFDDLAMAYAVADLTICRAGAMTISELAVTGTPAIFIPYPFAAANHQSHNANFIAGKGAALVIPQDKLSSYLLIEEIKKIIQDPDQLKTMRRAMSIEGKPRATEDLANQVKEISTVYQINRSRERFKPVH